MIPHTAFDRALRGLWLLCFFAAPLLFFTDLTRNPYATQTALLELSLLAVLAVWALRSAQEGSWPIPTTPMNWPLGAWLSICILSWSWAYIHHVDFFSGSIKAEGLRVLAFTVVGTVLPFFMGALCAQESGVPGSRHSSGGRWIAFFLVWGGLWTLFPGLRVSSSTLSFTGHLWDPYGGMLWIAGYFALFMLTSSGTVGDFWHVALGVACLSSIYAICQYFSIDFIWPRFLNPYGGRAVSTFGNPNFMSSYLVIFLPIVVLFYLKARRGRARWIYAGACLMMEGGLLASLTRSSWMGAAVALLVLFSSKIVRELIKESKRFHGATLAAAVILAILWPRSPVQGAAPTPVGRILELSSIMDVKSSQPYSPFYQRLLIWSCAWTMGNENPLLGKGWGLFDMFYPFYQGPLIASSNLFRMLRTHGNNAHNEILEIWAQTGLVGLGVFLWMWTTFFASVRRRIQSAAESEWIVATSAGIAGMLADNMLNVSLHFAVPAFAFWWQAGVAMGAASHIPSQRPSPLRREGILRQVLAYTCAFAVVLACGWTGRWRVYQWNRDVRYFLGFKLFHNGELSAAVKMLETAYGWNAKDVNTDYELGNAYARSGQFERAVWAYHEALNANAGYDEIYYNTGAVLAGQLHRSDEAVKYFQTAHWINPLWPAVYKGLSAVYMGDAKYRDRAIPLLEQAVHFFPDDATFLTNLAYLYGLNHEKLKSAAAYQNLGEVYLRLGRTQNAEAAFKAVLQMDPGNRVARIRISEINK